MTTLTYSYPRFFYRSYLWAKKAKLAPAMAILLTAGAVISGIITYFSISQSNSPFGPNPQTVMALLLTNLVLILALMTLISRKLVKLWVERRQGSIGSRLQTRIVLIFSLVAITPTIIVSVFSALFFNYGIQSWFNERVSTALEGSVAVAEAYLEEHKEVLRGDILAMAWDLNRASPQLLQDPKLFNQVISGQTALRNLTEAMVIQRSTQKILAQATLSFSLAFEHIDDEVFERARNGEVVLITDDTDEKVRAVLKLENYFDSYLLVGRLVDSTVLKHMEATQGAAREYSALKGTISKLQIQFSIIFLVVAVLLLLATIWGAIMFAIDIVNPISKMVTATEDVKHGNLTIRVDERPHHNDELGILSRAFNRMIEQLEHQRRELISAQRSEAWQDVARRIAHEIKNPLTPILLATERLKSKYGKEVGDQETYNKYIDTIARHTEHVGKIVEEFVQFARMPSPEFKQHDLATLLQQTIFSQKTANSTIHFDLDVPDEPALVKCDSDQIQQVIGNILKNASESIFNRFGEDSKVGNIIITLTKQSTGYQIDISDNGKGFPEHLIHRLTEPYITTRSKGTGLGLAIVKKIIEDHTGTLFFSNHDNGALIRIYLPFQPTQLSNF